MKHPSTHKNVMTVKNLPKKSHLKVPGGLESQQTLTVWPFSGVLSVYGRLFQLCATLKLSGSVVVVVVVVGVVVVIVALYSSYHKNLS